MFAGLTMQFVTVGIPLGLSVLYPQFVQQFNEKRSSAALVQGICVGMTVAGGKNISVSVYNN